MLLVQMMMTAPNNRFHDGWMKGHARRIKWVVCRPTRGRGHLGGGGPHCSKVVAGVCDAIPAATAAETRGELYSCQERSSAAADGSSAAPDFRGPAASRRVQLGRNNNIII